MKDGARGGAAGVLASTLTWRNHGKHATASLAYPGAGAGGVEIPPPPLQKLSRRERRRETLARVKLSNSEAANISISAAAIKLQIRQSEFVNLDFAQ